MKNLTTTHSMAAEMLNLIRSKTTYVALLRDIPEKDGSGGREVEEASYSRMPIAFSDPSGSIMTSTERIDFPMPLTPWGEVAAYAIYDAETGGNMLWSGSFEYAVTATIGSHFSINPGGIIISVGLNNGQN